MIQCLHIVKNTHTECAAICHVVAGLSKGLAPLGYRTSVVFLSGEGPLLGQFRAAGVDAYACAWTGTASDLRGAGAFFLLARALRPDIVHVHHGGLSVRLPARLCGGAVVQHVHSPILENTGERLCATRFRGAHAVIATSRAVASCVRAAKLEVIYPGVVVGSSPEPLQPKDYMLIGAAARLVPLKGLADLISALSRLRTRGINARLQIAGEGPEEQRLRTHAQECGVLQEVEFLGWRSDLSRIRAAWDVAVVPSLEEGFGLSALEAMAIGRAVVASRVGGLAELIEDGVSGLLVAPEHTDALAAALFRLAGQRERLASMGAAAWQRARCYFSAERMAEATHGLYQRVLFPAKALAPVC